MAEWGSQLKAEGLQILPYLPPPNSRHASSLGSIWFTSRILQMGKLRPTARHSLAQGDTAELEPVSRVSGFLAHLLSAVMHCLLQTRSLLGGGVRGEAARSTAVLEINS